MHGMPGLHELRAGPDKIRCAAFLFSTPYCCAMALALLEFMIEHWLAPSTKSYKVGLLKQGCPPAKATSEDEHLTGHSQLWGAAHRHGRDHQKDSHSYSQS